MRHFLLLLALGCAAPVLAQPDISRAKQAPIDRGLLKMQVVLDRLGFSPGVIDGRPGMSLTAAIKGFQESRDIPVTGRPDARTMQALAP
jgi:peptidoglycan hydrolase-like protein with peptidoglycan-binding domain